MHIMQGWLHNFFEAKGRKLETHRDETGGWLTCFFADGAAGSLTTSC